MWQVEDLLRANGLSPEKINETLVGQYTLSDDAASELLQWYKDLIEMMRNEGVKENGHLQINKNVIINLTDLHLRLDRKSVV